MNETLAQRNYTNGPIQRQGGRRVGNRGRIQRVEPRGAYHGVMPGGRVPGVVGDGAPAEEVPRHELRRPAAVRSPRHEPHRLGRHLLAQHAEQGRPCLSTAYARS
uniref:Uncharacterized protein n=1 Tax=Arundo donax TaxID=35708 RepID=A0A0A9DF36_ARUDO